MKLSANSNVSKKSSNSKSNGNQQQQPGGQAKRVIDRSIEKNRGLTPYRKKDNRNARVKHRKKYEKALKRRRGQVRDVMANDRPYEGEATGINPHVVRAVQLGPKK